MSFKKGILIEDTKTLSILAHGLKRWRILNIIFPGAIGENIVYTELFIIVLILLIIYSPTDLCLYCNLRSLAHFMILSFILFFFSFLFHSKFIHFSNHMTSFVPSSIWNSVLCWLNLKPNALLSTTWKLSNNCTYENRWYESLYAASSFVFNFTFS